jgi:hypothetical protein
VTARFGSVVLKASFTPLFPQVVDVHVLLEAREFARVQAAVAKLDLTRLPVFDVRRVPGALLEDDLSDQSVELVQWLRDA